jgi:hypothetical protein
MEQMAPRVSILLGDALGRPTKDLRTHHRSNAGVKLKLGMSRVHFLDRLVKLAL